MVQSARMGGRRLLSLAALLPLVGLASAAQWTVTSYFVAQVTTEIYEYYDGPETYTYTEFAGLKPDVTAAASAASETSTYTDDYYNLEVVYVFLDPEKVDSEDIATTTTDDYYDDYDRVYTDYVQPIVMTAPESCPTPFTFSTHTVVYIPSEVIDQYTDVSVLTDVYTYADGDKYTQVTAYLEEDAITLSEAVTENYYYSYYVADCINPTGGNDYYDDDYTDDYTYTYPSATRTGFIGDDDDTRNDDPIMTGTRFGVEECDSLMKCGWVTTGLIAIAAILPAIFLLGFIESYFWFRRLMTGKSAFRFGTICWMILFLPVMCLTRRVPAREADSQAALREQWKTVSFGKAIGLWFKYGFRHKYPVELLGQHPTYISAITGIPGDGTSPLPGGGPVMAQQPIGYGPPPAAGNRGSQQPPFIYYMPTPGADGQQPGGVPGPTQVAGMPPPANRGSYYPQYPQPVYAAPQQEAAQPATNMTPSPLSQEAEPTTREAPPRVDVPPPATTSLSQDIAQETGESSASRPAPQTEGGPSGTRRDES